ncbi:MAG: PH domain-containing protein [Chloroflexi bacterium]|nr:PH domain-containing protein [Chloroflexota bacterium]
MSYSKSILLYQDEPTHGMVLNLIIVIVPGMLLLSSIYLWSSGDSAGGLALLFEALFVGLIFRFVFPRRYQVYEDHLRIVLGGPFSVKIGFDQIKTVEVTSKMAFTVNFATAVTRTYVRIIPRKGLSIAITPKSNELFVDNANRASSEWARTRIVEAPARTTR